MRPENPIGVPFNELSEVDSSNNYAMRQVQAQMAGHGATWFARYQNAGKGQRGKPWDAEPGQNIMMSSVVEPGLLPIENQFLLNMMVALSCYDFFNKYTKSDTCIKWPNDIYWKDRKAGGILIENVLKGKEWRFSIVGIGLNINQTLFSANLPNPVSLKQITGMTFNVVDLAKQLCDCLNQRWRQLQSGEYQKLMDEYISRLYKLQQIVTLRKQTKVFEATITGINDRGELLTDSPEYSTLVHGSVEWILPQLK